MSLTSRSVATATDFNGLLAGVLSLYGVGSGDRGFGQTALALDPIEAGQRITAAQWGILRGMLGVCVAQEGLDPSVLPSMPKVGIVTPSAVAFSDVLNTVDAGRFTHASDAMSVVNDVVVGKMNAIWNGVLQLTVDVDFMSEDDARFFFNSGGRIRLTPSHDTRTTAYDNIYGSFLTRQVGTISIGAHETTWSAGSVSGETVGGYYGFEPGDALILSQDSSTSSSGFPDNVRVRARRTNFSGVNSGNGRSFQITVQMQYLGDAAGSVLSSGTQVSVGIIYASKYVKVATPNIAITGFSLTSKGTPSVESSGDGGLSASVPPIDAPKVFSPDVGTVRYTVPEYATLTVELSGAGGSEGASTGPYPRSDGSAILLVNGDAGGDTAIASLGLTATGGAGGGCYNPKTAKTGPVGASGMGLGGDVNTTGGGSSGGAGRYPSQQSWHNGASGGPGGYIRKVFVRGAADAPAPGSVLVAVVPEGGSLSQTVIPTDPATVFYPGADGRDGLVNISAVSAGSGGTVSFSVPGSYQFRVPAYASLTFSVRGAGGGAAHNLSPALSGEDPTLLARDGEAGGDASVVFLNLVATGGQGGQNTQDPGFPGPPSPIPGAVGTGTGGDVNADGLGGQGGGADTGLTNGGGGGGYAQKTVRPDDTGAPIIGQTLLVIVPAGGLGAEASPLAKTLGITNPPGQDGNVTITWTIVDQPSAAGSVLVKS